MNENGCGNEECNDPEYTEPYVVPALPENEEEGGGGGGADSSKLPTSMVYDFVSPTGDNNPSTAENANITARVVNTTTGAISNTTLMVPMATGKKAGSITAAEKTKITNLPAITSIGDGLELSTEGELSVPDGEGSNINVLSAYKSSPTEGNVYDASYINGRLNNIALAIGKNTEATALSTIALGGSDSIGGARTTKSYAIAIGAGSRVFTTYGITLGVSAIVHYEDSHSVALGSGSITSRPNEVAIGSASTGTTSAPATRFLANVTPGELDTDAVNVSQLNAALARIEALETEVAALKGEQTA